MQVSLITPKCCLVPKHFFNPSCAGDSLAQVFELSPADEVKWVEVPGREAVLIYADSDEYEKMLLEDAPGDSAEPRPEMLFVLEDMARCQDYNKIVCSFVGGHLYLAIGQGHNLLLCNTYKAPDFTTAQYFIFLAMKSLQLNPEVSTICLRSGIRGEDEMSLYRYFKAVEEL